MDVDNDGVVSISELCQTFEGDTMKIAKSRVADKTLENDTALAKALFEVVSGEGQALKVRRDSFEAFVAFGFESPFPTHFFFFAL